MDMAAVGILTGVGILGFGCCVMLCLRRRPPVLNERARLVVMRPTTRPHWKIKELIVQ